MGKALDFISPELAPEEKILLSPRQNPYGGIIPGAALIKRSVFKKIGGFSEEFITGENIDFLLRAKDNGVRILQIDYVTVNRRLHNNNTGRTMKKQEHKDYASLLRRKLAARRG